MPRMENVAPERVVLQERTHPNAARESLFGMRQTDQRGERVVLMVRAAEETVLFSPRYDLERRMAFHDRPPGEARTAASTVATIAPALPGKPKGGGVNRVKGRDKPRHRR